MSARQTAVNCASTLVAATTQPGEPVRVGDVLELAGQLYAFVWQGKPLPTEEPGPEAKQSVLVSEEGTEAILKLAGELEWPLVRLTNSLRVHYGVEEVRELTRDEARAQYRGMLFQRLEALINQAKDTPALSPIKYQMNKSTRILTAAQLSYLQKKIEAKEAEYTAIKGDVPPIEDDNTLLFGPPSEETRAGGAPLLLTIQRATSARELTAVSAKVYETPMTDPQRATYQKALEDQAAALQGKKS